VPLGPLWSSVILEKEQDKPLYVETLARLGKYTFTSLPGLLPIIPWLIPVLFSLSGCKRLQQISLQNKTVYLIVTSPSQGRKKIIVKTVLFLFSI